MDKTHYNFISIWHYVSQETVKVTPKILTGVIILIVFWVVAFIVKHCIVRAANHSKTRLYLYRLIGSLAMVLILFAGLITALGTIGINVGALVASLGVTGFGLSFAMKDTISNLMAGFLVLFYQPFKSGDYISVQSVEGKVVDVNLRYTVIKSPEKHVFVPNSVILGNPLTVKEP